MQSVFERLVVWRWSGEAVACWRLQASAGTAWPRTGSAEPLGCSASVDFRNVLITL